MNLSIEENHFFYLDKNIDNEYRYKSDEKKRRGARYYNHSEQHLVNASHQGFERIGYASLGSVYVL